MILESYVQALLKLIDEKKITAENIKSEEYKTEVQARLNNTSTQ